MFSFGLSSVISKVFVADFEHVFFCWKRHSTKTIVVLILKYLAQQTNTYSYSAAETLKANSRDCTSSLTTCTMPKALFKCFLCTMNMPLFTAMFLLLRFLLWILNRFHILPTFICYQFWTGSRGSHQRCSLKKMFSKIMQYFQENACVRISF